MNIMDVADRYKKRDIKYFFLWLHLFAWSQFFCWRDKSLATFGTCFYQTALKLLSTKNTVWIINHGDSWIVHQRFTFTCQLVIKYIFVSFSYSKVKYLAPKKLHNKMPQYWILSDCWCYLSFAFVLSDWFAPLTFREISQRQNESLLVSFQNGKFLVSML